MTPWRKLSEGEPKGRLCAVKTVDGRIDRCIKYDDDDLGEGGKAFWIDASAFYYARHITHYLLLEDLAVPEE